MPHSPFRIAIAAALAAPFLAGHAQPVKQGADALGDWTTDAPGVVRHIRPQDVQPPSGARVGASRSQVVAPAANAVPRTMDGFSVAPYARLPGARTLRVAPNGDVFVARSSRGAITVLRPAQGGDKPQADETYAEQLDYPYGLAFWPPGPSPQWLYVGTETRVVRYPYRPGDLKARGAPEVVVDHLPGGGHRTRDIAFSPDGRQLYVAVGSRSNVGAEMGARPASLQAWERQHGAGAAWGDETGRATVLAFTPTGGERRVVATGIRNCAGIAVQPGSGHVFCATNERDLLGDDTPPDYVTSVKPGGFYGWPWYYAGGHEDRRPSGGARPDLKDKLLTPDVLIQPHSAPLGIAFNPGGMFPPAWKGDAFVTLHGSWNRERRTGYKVVRLPAADGVLRGTYQDFVTGFSLDDERVWGRPVGITFAADGSLLFSEDGNGVIYRVTYGGR